MRGRRGTWSSIFALMVPLVSMLAVTPVENSAAEPPVTVTTRTEPQSTQVGTPFRYFVRIESSSDAELILPLLVDQIGEFLIRDFGSTPPGELAAGATDGNGAGQKQVSEQWYELVGYSTGPQLIKGGVIGYRVAGSGIEEVEIPEAVISIESLLPAESEMAIADIKEIVGPVGVPHDESAFYWALAGLALLLCLLAAALRWFWLRSAESTVPPRPPHEVALEALTHLRRSKLLEEGRQPEYYVRLSSIVRDYVEKRFQVRAPEMTTEEFLQAAQSKAELAAEHRSRLSMFLSEADLVKFARHVPTVEQGEKAYEAAREFVTTTKIESREEEQDAAA